MSKYMKYDIIVVGAGTPNCNDAARCRECGSEDFGFDVPDAYRAGIRHQREFHGPDVKRRERAEMMMSAFVGAHAARMESGS